MIVFVQMKSHNKHSNQIKNKSIARITSPKTFFFSQATETSENFQ